VDGCLKGLGEAWVRCSTFWLLGYTSSFNGWILFMGNRIQILLPTPIPNGEEFFLNPYLWNSSYSNHNRGFPHGLTGIGSPLTFSIALGGF
jgi:hypothetical protein